MSHAYNISRALRLAQEAETAIYDAMYAAEDDGWFSLEHECSAALTTANALTNALSGMDARVHEEEG